MLPAFDTPIEYRCNQRFVVFSLLSKEKKESLLYAFLSIELLEPRRHK